MAEPCKAESDLRLLRRALDVPRLTLSEFAVLTGMSFHTLRAYRLGRIRPSRKAQLRMAGALIAHAQNLLSLAEELVRRGAGEEA